MDPDTQDFHDFRDQEIELVCDHEEGASGVTFERWHLLAGNPNLKDKLRLRRLDSILAREQGIGPDSGEYGPTIADEVLPF